MKHARLAPLALAMLVACSRESTPTPVLPARNVAQIELGRKVYNFRCYFCHGYSGDARTLAATYLEPPPRDFTRAQCAKADRVPR